MKRWSDYYWRLVIANKTAKIGVNFHFLSPELFVDLHSEWRRLSSCRWSSCYNFIQVRQGLKGSTVLLNIGNKSCPTYLCVFGCNKNSNKQTIKDSIQNVHDIKNLNWKFSWKFYITFIADQNEYIFVNNQWRRQTFMPAHVYDLHSCLFKYSCT